MRDLAYYDGLIADCLHRAPEENLARLPATMMPNDKNHRQADGLPADCPRALES